MSTREDYIEKIKELVHGENLLLGETEMGFAIDAAMKKHSKFRPRFIIEKETGDGGFDYAITDLASWKSGFSSIRRIEYPVDDDSQDADFVDDNDWEYFYTEHATGDKTQYIRFLKDEPTSSQYFRVHYTTFHTCASGATCTVEDYDEEAVQMLAASNFCDMLATAYAQDKDTTINADSVDHGGKSKEYAARAKTYKAYYFNHLGMKEGETPPASIIDDQDVGGSWKSDRLSPMWQRSNR
jgi:hypothetical protein